MKRSFFQAAIVLILRYEYTTWMLINGWRKSLTTTTQESCEQYLSSPGDNTQQSSIYTATYHPSRKLSKLNEPDTRDTAEDVGTSSQGMYSCGPLHMHEQRQDVQFEHTYSSCVPIRYVTLMISKKQWTIGRCGERRSGISVLIARHDIYIYIYIHEVQQISFQTFFIWAFEIVVDFWKFSMLLLYILWDDWPIFMISGSNQQLQQESEYILL